MVCELVCFNYSSIVPEMRFEVRNWLVLRVSDMLWLVLAGGAFDFTRLPLVAVPPPALLEVFGG